MWQLTDEEFKRIQREFPYPDSCPTCGVSKTYKLNGEDFPCECKKQKLAAHYYYAANIPRRYHSLGLDDFMPREQNSGVIEAIEEYIENFEYHYHYGSGLGLQGPQGTGKTLLAVYVLKEVVRQGYRGFFMQFADVINTWGSAWKDNEAKELLERNLKQPALLILDDITVDARNKEGFLQAGLEAVLRSRSNNSLPTILTTNMRVQEIESAFPRPYSLISGVTDWLDVHGSDYRPTNYNEIQYLIREKEKLPVK